MEARPTEKNGTLTEKPCLKIPGVFPKKTQRQCERKVKLGLVERSVLKEIEKKHIQCVTKKMSQCKLVSFFKRWLDSWIRKNPSGQGKDQTHEIEPLLKSEPFSKGKAGTCEHDSAFKKKVPRLKEAKRNSNFEWCNMVS